MRATVPSYIGFLPMATILLWNEDHVQDNTYNTAYKYDLRWNVPSFAPKGLYNVTISATGNVEEAGLENGEVICVNAKM